MATLEGFEHMDLPEVQDSEVNSTNGSDDLGEVYPRSRALSVREDDVLTVPFPSTGGFSGWPVTSNIF